MVDMADLRSLDWPWSSCVFRPARRTVGRRRGWLILGLLLFGLPYTLASLMISFLHDSPWVAAPPMVLHALLRHGCSFFPVLLQSSAMVALGCVAFGLASILRDSHFGLYLVVARLLGICDLDGPRHDARSRPALPSAPGPPEMAACQPAMGSALEALSQGSRSGGGLLAGDPDCRLIPTRGSLRPGRRGLRGSSRQRLVGRGSRRSGACPGRRDSARLP